MTNEEIIAAAVATAWREWHEPFVRRIVELERSNIERGAEIKLLKELVLNKGNQKHAPADDAPPWRPALKIDSGGRRSIKLEH